MSDDVLRIVLLGSAGIGAKTSLAHYLIHGTFEQHTDPTIEETYNTSLEVDGQTFKLEILGLFLLSLTPDFIA